MKLLAIDPGPVESGWVIVDEHATVLHHGKDTNQVVLLMATTWHDDLAIEMIASYGMAVGREVFETCVWVGRYKQAFRNPDDVIIKYRKDVKMHLCGTNTAKDSNIRQAILDLYPRTGGGACPQKGTKGQPGPLFGLSKDEWPALGVALTVLGVSDPILIDSL